VHATYCSAHMVSATRQHPLWPSDREKVSLRSHFATLKKRPSQVFADGLRRLVTMDDFPFRISFMSTGPKTNYRPEPCRILHSWA